MISYIYQGKCENSSREVVAMMKVCATILGLDIEIKEEAVAPLKSKEKKKATRMRRRYTRWRLSSTSGSC